MNEFSRSMMSNTMSQKHIFPLLLCLLLLLSSLGACGAEPTPEAVMTPTAAPPTPTPEPPVRVSRETLLEASVVYTALGASDAAGVGADTPEEGYVSQLAARLPAGSQTVNLGETGMLLHDALEEELPEAIAAEPQLVTIWLATNDFVAQIPYEEYMQDLDTLLQQLHDETLAYIVIANIPDITVLPSLDWLTESEKENVYVEIQHWNSGIADVAEQHGVALVDLFGGEEQLGSRAEYVGSDGFHPSSAGHARLAEYFWEEIQPEE